MRPDAAVRQIAFVTRRFGELQGLITATGGAGLLAAAALGHYGFAPGEIYFLPLMLIGGGMATSAPYLIQLYRESYGDVSPRARIGRTPFVLFVVQLGILVDAFVASPRGPSFGAVAVASYAVLVVCRDAPWRLHYLVVLASALVGVALSTAEPRSGASWQWFDLDAGRRAALLLTYAIIGFALVIAGALDHALLSRALSSAPAPGERHAVARTRAANGAPRAVIAGSFAVALSFVVWSRHPVPLMLMFVFLPLMLVVPLVVSVDTYKGKMRGRPARSLAAMVSREDLLSITALATALTLDLFVGVPQVSLFAATLAGACAWVVVRDWPLRPHYLIGCGAAVFSVIRYPANPAEAPAWFATFLFLTSAALTVESLADCWVARRLRAVPGGVHADAL